MKSNIQKKHVFKETFDLSDSRKNLIMVNYSCRDIIEGISFQEAEIKANKESEKSKAVFKKSRKSLFYSSGKVSPEIIRNPNSGNALIDNNTSTANVKINFYNMKEEIKEDFDYQDSVSQSKTT